MFRIMEASERFGGGAREGLAMHVQEDRQEWSPGGSCTFRLPCALFFAAFIRFLEQAVP